MTSDCSAQSTPSPTHWTNPAARIKTSLPEGLTQLPPELELVVYRIAQEALTNAVRHSGASRIELELEVGSRRLTLRVSDDGTGLPPRRAKAPEYGGCASGHSWSADACTSGPSTDHDRPAGHHHPARHPGHRHGRVAMTGAGVTRVLIADDHAVVRAGLKTLIDREPDLEVVAEAADGREALQLGVSERPRPRASSTSPCRA